MHCIIAIHTLLAHDAVHLGAHAAGIHMNLTDCGVGLARKDDAINGLIFAANLPSYHRRNHATSIEPERVSPFIAKRVEIVGTLGTGARLGRLGPDDMSPDSVLIRVLTWNGVCHYGLLIYGITRYLYYIVWEWKVCNAHREAQVASADTTEADAL